MWKILAVFCVLCSAVTAQDIRSSETVTTSSLRETLYNTFINTVFDKVLSSVAKSKAIDPVTLPNISYAVRDQDHREDHRGGRPLPRHPGGFVQPDQNGQLPFRGRGTRHRHQGGRGCWATQLQLRGTRTCHGLRPGGHGGRQTINNNLPRITTLELAQTPGSQLELSEFKVQQSEGGNRCHPRLGAS
uniref:Putative secreted protein n=1 Tax=Ixodes ricinus TaxID=34613 RepID=A0A090X9L7_IXORI